MRVWRPPSHWLAKMSEGRRLDHLLNTQVAVPNQQLRPIKYMYINMELFHRKLNSLSNPTTNQSMDSPCDRRTGAPAPVRSHSVKQYRLYHCDSTVTALGTMQRPKQPIIAPYLERWHLYSNFGQHYHIRQTREYRYHIRKRPEYRYHISKIITLQCDILTLVWLFGPANVTFLDLPMWLFGPEAVPCQWHPPPRIKKKHRNRIKIKRDNKNQFQWHNNRRNTQTQEPRCFPCIQYIYFGQFCAQHLSKELCAFNARNRLLRLADQ